jgi:AraC-like DNA-binding protein
LENYTIRMRQSNMFYFSGFGHIETSSAQYIIHEATIEYILHFVFKGVVHCQIDDTKVDFCAGQVFIVTPQSRIIYTTDEGRAWECCVVSFNGTEVHELLKSLGIDKENPVLTFQNPELLRSTYQKMVDVFKLQSNNIYSYLGNLLIIFSLIDKKEANDIGSLVNRIKEYVHMFYMMDISVEKISNNFNMDRSNLFRIFKNATGISIVHYIIDYRVERAKDLLMINQMNITEVSFACGFGSSSHFASVFKEKTGLTPKEFCNLYHDSTRK